MENCSANNKCDSIHREQVGTGCWLSSSILTSEKSCDKVKTSQKPHSIINSKQKLSMFNFKADSKKHKKRSRCNAAASKSDHEMPKQVSSSSSSGGGVSSIPQNARMIVFNGTSASSFRFLAQGRTQTSSDGQSEDMADEAPPHETQMERKRRLNRNNERKKRAKKVLKIEELTSKYHELSSQNEALKSNSREIREAIALVKRQVAGSVATRGVQPVVGAALPVTGAAQPARPSTFSSELLAALVNNSSSNVSRVGNNAEEVLATVKMLDHCYARNISSTQPSVSSLGSQDNFGLLPRQERISLLQQEYEKQMHILALLRRQQESIGRESFDISNSMASAALTTSRRLGTSAELPIDVANLSSLMRNAEVVNHTSTHNATYSASMAASQLEGLPAWSAEVPIDISGMLSSMINTQFSRQLETSPPVAQSILAQAPDVNRSTMERQLLAFLQHNQNEMQTRHEGAGGEGGGCRLS